MIQAISCAVGVSAANSQCSALRLPVGGYAARFCRFPTSGARISPGVIRSGLPPYSGLIWPDLPARHPQPLPQEINVNVRPQLAQQLETSILSLGGGPRSSCLVDEDDGYGGFEGGFGSGQEWQTFNFRSFPSISTHSLSSMRAGDARFPHSRERRGTFVVTTYAIMVGVGAAMAQGAVVVGYPRVDVYCNRYITVV